MKGTLISLEWVKKLNANNIDHPIGFKVKKYILEWASIQLVWFQVQAATHRVHRQIAMLNGKRKVGNCF